jgi:CubicO group peptidase (beta-lactamase class C family)
MGKFKLLFFAVLVSTALNAQPQTLKEKANAYLTQLAQYNKFMGSIAISKNGVPLFAEAYGFSNVEKQIKPNTNTLYCIGSITKTYTAALIMQLVDAKKLKLTDKLATYFPNIKNSKKITINHLLNHTSGIYNFTDDSVFGTIQFKPTTKQKMLKWFSSFEPVFEPGAKFDYSNTGYLLLGYIIEAVTKKSYEQNITTNIFNKIKEGKFLVNCPKDSTHSYNYGGAGKWLKQGETNVQVTFSAGSIYSNPISNNLFITQLMQQKLTSANSLQLMKKLTNGYGFGLTTVPFNKTTFYGHTGGIDGYNSITIYNPKDSISFSATFNAHNYQINDIYIALLSFVYDKPVTLPTTADLEEKIANLEELKTYEGMYACAELKMEAKIFINDKILYGQVVGQPSFPLSPTTTSKMFEYNEAGVTIVFGDLENNSSNQFTLIQGGKYIFKRKKE